ncbi:MULTISPECIES: NUDIX hydrolase [Brevibacillus]|uniref:UDP-sugar hydrolase n=1 Tax=Brevibacillus brevis (strain 47 / JCM 6285 / NBRC 100599) TaxID=358681 RepID=C0ZKS6_BREBN|nr:MULTISPECIES: NUDIX domain-containing protein [Brevibacillus]NRS48162.1 NUDIX domain-containing protein [Brevibacillus sp. HB2.2]BAH45753.1 UDP-sugar hydrolase [Brevibacillus brevis NBRC 100599]
MNDYIQTMRRLIGQERLITVGCGAIIEDELGRILLQRRKDQNNWCLPGGLMEIGETFIETLFREVEEETNLIIEAPELFGIYSGPSGCREYPNGDKVFSVQIIFRVTSFHGELKQEGPESSEHTFFTRDNLPQTLNPGQAAFILDWAEGLMGPIVK